VARNDVNLCAEHDFFASQKNHFSLRSAQNSLTAVCYTQGAVQATGAGRLRPL